MKTYIANILVSKHASFVGEHFRGIVVKADNEQEALKQLQEQGYNSFELFESIGKYRKKEVIELEKY